MLKLTTECECIFEAFSPQYQTAYEAKETKTVCSCNLFVLFVFGPFFHVSNVFFTQMRAHMETRVARRKWCWSHTSLCGVKIPTESQQHFVKHSVWFALANVLASCSPSEDSCSKMTCSGGCQLRLVALLKFVLWSSVSAGPCSNECQRIGLALQAHGPEEA